MPTPSQIRNPPLVRDVSDLLPELHPDLFPSDVSPPDIVFQVQRPVPPQLPAPNPAAPPDGCLPDPLFETLINELKQKLLAAGFGDASAAEGPDVRSACVALQVPQRVPGATEPVLRFASTIGVWARKSARLGEDQARNKALATTDALQGIETFYTAIGIRVRGTFMKRQSAAEAARGARNDSGDVDPEGKIHLTGATVVLDQPPDTVVTTIAGFRDIPGPKDVEFTLGLTERIDHDDRAGAPRCTKDPLLRVPNSILARALLEALKKRGVALEDLVPAGALGTIAENLFLRDVVGIRLAYVDFAINEVAVAARASVGGISIDGPGQLTIDPRTSPPFGYSASVFEGPADIPPFASGVRPFTFRWSVDRGIAKTPDASTTAVVFDLAGKSGGLIRHITLAVTDSRGLTCSVTRAIRIQAVFIETPR